MSQTVSDPAPLVLRLSSDPANLAPLRHELERFCAACGFGDGPRGQIVLCVNEALTNITRHAYSGAPDRPVELAAAFDDGTLRISIRDWGAGQLPPECAAPRNPLTPGGIGMVCLRELMDCVRFNPQPDGMLLLLERRLDPLAGPMSGEASGT